MEDRTEKNTFYSLKEMSKVKILEGTSEISVLQERKLLAKHENEYIYIYIYSKAVC